MAINVGLDSRALDIWRKSLQNKLAYAVYRYRRDLLVASVKRNFESRLETREPTDVVARSLTADLGEPFYFSLSLPLFFTFSLPLLLFLLFFGAMVAILLFLFNQCKLNEVMP